MAPQVGLEPTTLRLTAGCSAIELLRSGQNDSPKPDEPLIQCHYHDSIPRQSRKETKELPFRLTNHPNSAPYCCHQNRHDWRKDRLAPVAFTPGSLRFNARFNYWLSFHPESFFVRPRSTITVQVNPPDFQAQGHI